MKWFEQLPSRRLALETAKVAAPSAAVLIVLSLAGALRPITALLAFLAIVAMLAILAARQLLLHRAAVSRLDQLGRAASNVASSASNGLDLHQDLAPAIDRLSAAIAERDAALQSHQLGRDALLDAIPEGLILIDAGKRITRANAKARELFGAELIDHDLTSVLRDPGVLDAIEEVLAGAASRAAVVTLPGAVERDLSITIARLAAAAGADGAVMLSTFDVTAIKRAERMRADFVANVSHELRTPLSTLLGFTETLQGHARDDPAARERFLGIMREQAMRMSRIVADLLSLSKIEANEHSPPSATVAIGPLIAGVVDGLSIQARAKEMTVAVEAAADLPLVVGDADQLAQVFQNLIDNAIKYGRPRTTVRVKAQAGLRPPGQALRLPTTLAAVSVTDEGDGIPREHLPRLTERFYRVDPGRSRQLGGTGLGLAIVKHIVNRHRGALTIDSEAGRGSVFTVYLPVAAGGSPDSAARAVGERLS